MFNKQNFCHVASNNRNEQKAGIFVYRTTDNLQTVTASGYFNEKLVDINLHDLIIHEQTDNADKTKVVYNILCVTERTLDNVGTQTILTDWEKALVVPTKLSDLTGDVAIVNPTNGQQLIYNSTTQKWENAVGGSGLPDQTGNAGKFLTTDGTDASWGNLKITSTQVIVGTTWNVAPYTVLVGVNSYSWTTSANYGVAVGYTAACYTYSIAVGANSIASGDYSIAVGYHATAPGNNSITIGAEAHSGARNSVCIGYDAETTSNAQNAIQIGSGVNRVANTLMVANGNGNFEMMSADGTIPEARLADTTSATEGQVLTLDANGNAKWEDVSGGGSGLNVGDTFMTKRTDNELNGAVECDGATYNTTDFIGTESIGALLEAGKLDYISLSAYSTAISTKGWCDKIGWNGTGNTQFRVPTLNAHIVQTNNIPVVGNGMVLGINGNGSGSYGNLYRYSNSDIVGTTIVPTSGSVHITTDPTKSGIIADTSDTAQLRVMIQLATGATDQALETCTGVLADVANLKDHRVIAFQAPTAQNNYTWYRKYADGWVEQGGIYDNGSLAESFETTITMPVVMSNNMYSATATASVDAGSSSYTAGSTVIFTHSTTQLGIAFYRATSNCKTRYLNWQVSGMAAS